MQHGQQRGCQAHLVWDTEVTDVGAPQAAAALSRRHTQRSKLRQAVLDAVMVVGTAGQHGIE